MDVGIFRIRSYDYNISKGSLSLAVDNANQ